MLGAVLAGTRADLRNMTYDSNSELGDYEDIFQTPMILHYRERRHRARTMGVSQSHGFDSDNAFIFHMILTPNLRKPEDVSYSIEFNCMY